MERIDHSYDVRVRYSDVARSLRAFISAIDEQAAAAAAAAASVDDFDGSSIAAHLVCAAISRDVMNVTKGQSER